MPRGRKKGFTPLNKTIWTDKMIQLLKDNYGTMTNKELAEALGLGLTSTRTKLYELGLKRMEMEYWSDEQARFLKSHYKKWGDTEIAEYFEQNFKKHKKWTTKHIRKKRLYLNLHRKSNQVGKIKIRNVVVRGSGRRSNYKRWRSSPIKPLGTIVRWFEYGKCRHFIKTEKGFVLLSRHNWENVHGTIPAGHVVVRINLEIEDFSISNLKCISRAESMKQNFQHNDNWYASMIARGDKKLKQKLLENKELLQLYRLNSQLRKEIKNVA